MGILFNNVVAQDVDFGLILVDLSQKTFVFKLKVTSVAKSTLLGKGTYNFALSGEPSGFLIFMTADGRLGYATKWNGNADHSYWQTAASSVAAGNSYRVVFSYDYSSTAKNPSCWINGVSKSLTETTAPSGAIDENTGTPNFLIGALPAGTTLGAPGGGSQGQGSSPDGELDDLAVYQGLATQVMVTADYAAYQAENLEASSWSGLTFKFRCLLRAAKDIDPNDYVGATLAATNTFSDICACAVGTPTGDPVGS